MEYREYWFGQGLGFCQLSMMKGERVETIEGIRKE